MGEYTHELEKDFADAKQQEEKKLMVEVLRETAGTIAKFEGRTPPPPEVQETNFFAILNQSVDFNKRLSQNVMQDEKPALLNLNGKRVCTPGSISIVMGLPKSRKTSFATLVAHAVLSQGAGGGMLTSDTANNQLLWVDTEQDEFFTYKGGQFIIDGELELTERLRYLEVANYSRSERLLYSLAMVAYYRPQFVILDGIGDMVDGVNDEGKAGNLFDILNHYAKKYETHFLCCLHTNKTGVDARGHLGSEIVRKCETAILCTITGEGESKSTEITPRYCRNGDFEKFNITHNNGKIEVFNGYQNSIKDIWNQSKEHIAQLEVKTAKNIASLLREVVTLEHGNPLSSRQAERAVQELTKEGYLARGEYSYGTGFTYTIEK